MSDNRNAVLIIGGRGEFGRFLQRDILPSLGAEIVLTLERDTPREQHADKLRQARHIILSTPLAGYVDRACELVRQCGAAQKPTTLWLISSVQASVWRAAGSTLAIVANPYLAAVFVHPMYGPNGFQAREREAETFRNILTATIDGPEHSLVDEVAEISLAFQKQLSIGTTRNFDPEEHDRVTAYSQGLSYCVAQVMFERQEIDVQVAERIPDLHRSFHANRNLINDFVSSNAFMPEVIAVFANSWLRTNQSTYADILHAFAEADMALGRGSISLIPTKWYAKLRSAAIADSRTPAC